MIEKAIFIKNMVIAIVLASAISGGLAGVSGFFAGKEWAEGRAAQRENKTLRDEIDNGRKALGEYRTAIADGATSLTTAATTLKVSATIYAEERDDALAQFNAASNTLQRKLDQRPDLAACLFGPAILQDINAARSGSPAVGPAGTSDPATGAGRRPAATVPGTAAPVGQRPGQHDGRAADPGRAPVPRLPKTPGRTR